MKPSPRRLLTLVVAVAVLVVLVIRLIPREDRESVGDLARDTSLIDQEIARLEWQARHLEPGSARMMKTQRKLERWRAKRDGRPNPDRPDEFARILHEMRVPSDRTVSEYRPGYRTRELQRARIARRARLDPPGLVPHAATASLPWLNRGPGNVSGRVRALVVDPDDATGNTWFVGAVGGGLWKTTDAGASWVDLAPDLPNLAVSALAMAESHHDILYAGTGESMFNIDVINGNGILKSIDRGATWSQLTSTLDDPAFNNIARIIVDPADPDVVLAAATTGRYKADLNPRSSIFKSVDGGATWTEVFAETDLGSFGRVKKVLQIIADPGDFGTQYATVDEKGILKSTDSGENWSYINTGITDFTGRFELAISPVNSNRLYVSAEGASHSELWISINGGATWTETVEQGGEPNWLGAQGWYDNTIVCHPTDVNVVYVGGIRLWQIQLLGGGQRATSLLSVGPVHVDHHNLIVIERSGSWWLLNANDGGIGLSSSQASGWSKPTDGLITTQFYGVDKRPGASAYIGGMQDNGTWRSPIDSGPLDPWTFQIGGDGYETSWHFNDPLKIIGGYQFNGITRSLDGGLTWSSATSGLDDTGSSNAPFITKIGKTNAKPDLLFAVGRQGVWRSADFGGSWSLTAIPSGDWGSLSSFLDIKVSRANPNIVWGGSRMDGSGRINVSTDQGLSFAPTANYSLVTMGGISGLSTHPTQDSTAYVLFSFAQRPKILRTTDLGSTWFDISGFGTDSVSANGFPDVAVYDLLVMPHAPDTLWAGTEIGLFESTNNGVTWAMASNGLPAVPIWAMTHVEDEVVLATHGRGIWSVKIPGLSAGQTYSPLIEGLAQGPDGFLNIQLRLRSGYDSTQVTVDGSVVATLPANPAGVMDTVQVPVVQDDTLTVMASGFQGGMSYDTPQKEIEVYLLATPVFAYYNDFNTPSSDFAGTGFTIGPQAGFPDDAIHTAHNYPDGQTAIYMLTVPIKLGSLGVHMTFDEVALIEPGEPGSSYGDLNFWDYVIVEGTRDGTTWLPLGDGYDADLHPEWRSAYDSATPGSPSLFRSHQFDLLQTFDPGDQILIRFRLYADAFVNGWGWVIDNVSINSAVTGMGDRDALANRFALRNAVPNPVRSGTAISFHLPEDREVRILLFDVQGRVVRRLTEGAVWPAGAHTVSWDTRDDRGQSVASGVYFYRMQAGSFSDVKRLTVIR